MTRRIGIPLVVLALLLACGYSVPPEPTRRAQCDQLDEVVGQVELVASAERGEGGGRLSPRGTRLLLYIGGEPYILDVATGQKERVVVDCVSATQWVTDDLLLVYCAIDHYYMVDTHDLDNMVTTDLSLVWFSETDLQGAEALLFQAGQVYVLERGVGAARRHVITLGGDTSHMLLLPLPGRDAAVDDLLALIPHQVVPEPRTRAPRYDAPNGQFYASPGSGGVKIYTTDDKLVARAFKSGWNHGILGWAYDSSGVYFKLTIDTTDGAVIYPWVPVFKLLAPTPSPGE